jgi:glycosyltransferase involved in cell wall biosynthesis
MRVRDRFNTISSWGKTMFLRATAGLGHADVAVFHDFVPPPWGGGSQFLSALVREMRDLGIVIEVNRISTSTKVCLINSFNFDLDRFRALRHGDLRVIHRVDGPVGAYRGFDDGTDQHVLEINNAFANATIFQSKYSLQKHLELGLRMVEPHYLIMNAADPDIFNRLGRVPLAKAGKVRLISSSWSNNPNKGFDVYQWLEKHLDWDRYEYTFVGRSPIQFQRIKMVPPVGSSQLAMLLKQHDIFVTASRNDPCSNALIEALSCGLPALYLCSGGHPEIVGEAGLGFHSPEELPSLLERLTAEYEAYQERIRAPDIRDVAIAYLEALGLEKGH